MSNNKGGRAGVKLDPATDEEVEQIRSEIDTVFIRKTRRGQGRHLHIPGDDDRPLCGGKKMTAFIEKDLAVYPPGFHDFCKDCVAKWRDQ